MDLPDIEKGCGETYAIESSPLGNKSCFDHLEPTSKEGKRTDGDLSGMKGIPTSCIEYYAKVNNISVLDLYSQLCDGVPIEVDLAKDNNKCVLETIKITL